MSDNYKVKVNDSFSFDINKESISKLDAVPTANHLHVLHHKKSYKATIVSISIKKKYTVKVNNNTYTVAITNDLDQSKIWVLK
jgi:hypothetical protein